jgi:hypothetical protein
MAASNAEQAYGTKIAIETAAGSGSYFELVESTDITPPKGTADKVDVTHLQSPGRGKEKRQGLIDYGTAQEKGNHVPGSATDLFLIAWATDGTTRSCRITWPDAHTQTFPGYCGGYGVDTLNSSSVLKRTLDIEVAGTVTNA